MAKSDAIQWYPGHMAKAERQIKEKLKLIDVVVEVLDSRVPVASRNPDVSKLIGMKQHLIILNKADLSDPVCNSKWETYFKKKENVHSVLLFNATDSKNQKKLVESIQALNDKKRAQIKCLFCGIPNVGKSTIINVLIKKKKAQSGNKPGVTRGQQWLATENNIMLLDTPGILWPKFDDITGKKLSWIGSIKDTLYEKENIAGDLMKFLLTYYPDNVVKTYHFSSSEISVPQAFDELCENRKLLLRGGDFDYYRASELLLTDFKNGRIGRITLDVI